MYVLMMCATACAEDPASTSERSIRPTGNTQTVEKLRPLTIALPDRALIPTPPEKPRNTTAIAEEASRTIFAPPDAVNLAIGKTIVSSDDAPLIGELNAITDGNRNGFDAEIVELMPDLQWVQIDVERRASLYAIAMWREDAGDMAGEHIVYRDVVVQIADDASFTENVRTIFNNDQDNSSGLGAGTDREYFETIHGKRIQLNGEVARYLRFYSNGNTRDRYNRYLEIEVFGVPAP